jgi:hypothetical protein
MLMKSLNRQEQLMSQIIITSLAPRLDLQLTAMGQEPLIQGTCTLCSIKTPELRTL